MKRNLLDTYLGIVAIDYEMIVWVSGMEILLKGGGDGMKELREDKVPRRVCVSGHIATP